MSLGDVTVWLLSALACNCYKNIITYYKHATLCAMSSATVLHRHLNSDTRTFFTFILLLQSLPFITMFGFLKFLWTTNRKTDTTGGLLRPMVSRVQEHLPKIIQGRTRTKDSEITNNNKWIGHNVQGLDIRSSEDYSEQNWVRETVLLLQSITR